MKGVERTLKNEYLSFEQVMDCIKSLSHSQGCYGRLYSAIMETEETKQQFKEIVEKEKFKDTMDFIFWYEC